MAFTFPTREQIFSAFISDYAGAQPDKNVSRGSDPYRLGRVISGVAWSVLAKILFYIKQMLPDTAEQAFLERWGSVFALSRNPAASSTGDDALEVTGTVGNAVPVDTELTHEDGTLYKVTTVGAVVGGGGSVTVSIAATSTGLATNKVTGEVLSFTSPPAGIDTEATLVADLSGGLDIEDIEDYRVRLLAHIGDPPEGGAIHDYVEWAKRISAVKSAYVWAHRRGVGTIDVAVLGPGTGEDRILNATNLLAVDDYIESVRPGNVRDWSLLTCQTQTQNVSLTIDIDDTLYSWDWDDAGVGYSVDSHDEGASTITSAAAPAAVKAGVRIQINGEEARVTNRTGNVLTLSFEDDFDGNPVSWFTFDPDGEDIRASGDLVRPVKNAIITLFNTLGPARSDFSATSWISELKLSKLNAAVTDVPGVDDTTITTPATTVSPTADTFGSAVYFLVPGYVEVLKP